MKFKSLIILSALVTCSAFTIRNVYSYQKSTKVRLSDPEKPDNYETEWKKVDSLQEKGLTTSALQLVETIYKRAKAGSNAPQLVKAIIHRIKFESEKEEFSLEKSIGKLNDELQTAKYPLTPVLHSIIAETYWQYFQNNRWRFYDRSPLTGIKPEDIATWDLTTIVKECIKHYQLSLQPADSLKRLPLNLYDEVLVKQNDSKKFRPSLYDFLAHRAIDFYANQEASIKVPASKFELTDSTAFSNYTVFSKLKFISDDSLSFNYYAVQLFQELLRLHANDADPQALVVLDLKRLNFMNNNAVVQGKEQFYLNALQQLQEQYIKHPVSSEVSYEIANFYYTGALNYASQKEEKDRQGFKNAIAVCEKAIKLFPESYGAQQCKVLIERISQKDVTLTTEEVNLPNKSFLGLLNYRNLSKLYFRIIQLPHLSENNTAADDESLQKAYLSYKPIKQWAIVLPANEDYQQHSAEIKLPALPIGNYRIIISADSTFKGKNNGFAYARIIISSISYINRSNKQKNEFYVMNRETGEPFSNVKAQVSAIKYDYGKRIYNPVTLGNYTSNAEGYILVSVNEDNRNSNYVVQFTSGKDTLLSDNNFYGYNYNRGNEKQKTIRTFFFTDRAIYRPGQTIYFKGITLETDGQINEVKTKYNSTVNFFDVNNQKIASLNLTTNEYGTFNGSFTAPSNGLNGNMRITNEKGIAYVSVEEYKRPKFEIKINPVKESFRLNEMVKITGAAKAYSGASLNGAQVKYKVVRNAVFDWWYKIGDRFPSSPEMQIANGLINTNDTGGFVVTFKAIPDLSVSKALKPSYNYTLYADVTDVNGETQSTSSTVTIGYSALILNTDVPQQLNKDSAAKFTLTVTNRSNEPQNAAGTIDVYKLVEPSKLIRKRKWEAPDQSVITREEFDKDFEQDPYMDEDDMLKWKRGAKVVTLAFDTKKEKTFELPSPQNLQAGAYVLEAKTTDAFGEEVKTLNYFTVYSAKGKNLPHVIDWFTAIKSKAEPGEKARFLIGSQEKNVKVLYEIEHKGELLKKEWLTLDREQKLIELPIEEKYRGNVVVHFVFVKNNRVYNHTETITVPYTNKELDITFETFRSKLLPNQLEEWKLKVKAKNGEKIAAEMLAAMYDASLNAFKEHNWYFNIYNNYYAQLSWSVAGRFGNTGSVLIAPEWNKYTELPNRLYDELNWFGYTTYGYDDVRYREMRMDEVTVSASVSGMSTKTGGIFKNKAANAQAMEAPPAIEKAAYKPGAAGDAQPKTNAEPPVVAARKNLNETAFFFPALQTDENGNVIIKFTAPEALTKWKFMALAHTHDLKYAQVTKEVVTQKELMVLPNAPRFLREQDKIIFTAKVSNLSENALGGKAQLFFYDALTMKDITSQLLKPEYATIDFTVKKAQSTPVSWSLLIPEGFSAVTYKIIATAGNYSDGEEAVLPVLTNRMLVTESLPIALRSNQTKTFTLDKLIKSGSSTTLKNHKLTLEFTANPAWYAVQALPYMMEQGDGCSEQVFSRFYANSIAAHVANASPKIQAVFNAWKTAGSNKEALLSNLEKNKELKAALLEETPWVLDAKDETEQKNRIGLLFDFNKMSYELNSAITKLKKMQAPNGGWPWFDGMPDDRYITQHIIAGMGHLDHLAIKTIRNDAPVWNMIKQGIGYLDARIREDYQELIKSKAKPEENNLSYIQIHYLYARSYFNDIPVDEQSVKAFNYYKEQAQKFWLKNNRYMQGMLALALNRYNDKKNPQDIIKSLKENALYSEELGMYWKEIENGYYWYQSFTETQALLIEAFDEVAKDKKSVDELRIALLKAKQTQNWKTSKATADACYALLLRGTDWLVSGSDVSITVGSQQLSPGGSSGQEAGTGYFKKIWDAADVKPELGKVTAAKKGDGISWGALYWQYFEQLDKITAAPNALNVEKQLYLQENTANGVAITAITGKTNLKTGDKLKVRIVIRVDRDMEYVHLKDMRAAGFEPTNVFSGYRWQDGLGYYESTRDAATHFFFSFLRKGTYVFEYPLVVSHNGNFSNGITTLQCMYAPEFTSHSEGIRITVGN